MKVYISLTSIYDNQEELLATLRSIREQTIKPDKCYIYLSEAPYLLDKGFKDQQLNQKLAKYLKRHKDLFTVKWCENNGPYRKLLPLLKRKWNEDCLIITIDDDTIYAPTLVENYLRDYMTYQCCISYRGFTPKFTQSIKEMSYYKHDQLKPTYLYNFHTGKGGVVYHPSFFKKTKDLIFDKSIYRDCCETADDIWFNFMRIANGIACHVENKQYMKKDQTTTYSLYRNFNMKNDLNTLNIQKTINKLIELGHLREKNVTFDSDEYWEARYKNHGSSGDGSYGNKAEFKGKIITDFINQRQIETIIDYGVGDGNQLKYINTTNKHYIGLDVSSTAVNLCREKFKDDSSKIFQTIADFNFSKKADLAISLDVIFHLVDDSIYASYMEHLFEMSQKYVIIHSVDNDYNEAQHVKFRKFTPYIEQNFNQWKLIDLIPNGLWTGLPGQMAFYIYEKCLIN
jgi:2-polyprenyl-3-methyl-5-hydroxy-6-metoxy-1,4-benzoquinol methylase